VTIAGTLDNSRIARDEALETGMSDGRDSSCATLDDLLVSIHG